MEELNDEGLVKKKKRPKRGSQHDYKFKHHVAAEKMEKYVRSKIILRIRLKRLAEEHRILGMQENLQRVIQHSPAAHVVAPWKNPTEGSPSPPS